MTSEDLLLLRAGYKLMIDRDASIRAGGPVVKAWVNAKGEPVDRAKARKEVFGAFPPGSSILLGIDGLTFIP